MNHNKQACTLEPARVTHNQCLICTVISVCEWRDRRGKSSLAVGGAGIRPGPQAWASGRRLRIGSGGLFLCWLLQRLGLRLTGKKHGEELLMAGLTTKYTLLK